MNGKLLEVVTNETCIARQRGRTKDIMMTEMVMTTVTIRTHDVITGNKNTQLTRFRGDERFGESFN